MGMPSAMPIWRLRHMLRRRYDGVKLLEQQRNDTPGGMHAGMDMGVRADMRLTRATHRWKDLAEAVISSTRASIPAR